MMKVSAVSSTSLANYGSSKKVNVKPVSQPCNPYRISDILPVTVGLGAGLMVAYAVKSGKLDPAVEKLKTFVKIA